jgi:hypothetical protein
MMIELVPGGELGATLISMVAEAFTPGEILSGFGLNANVTPGGAPVEARVTAPSKPAIELLVISADPDPP